MRIWWPFWPVMTSKEWRFRGDGTDLNSGSVVRRYRHGQIVGCAFLVLAASSGSLRLPRSSSKHNYVAVPWTNHFRLNLSPAGRGGLPNFSGQLPIIHLQVPDTPTPPSQHPTALFSQIPPSCPPAPASASSRKEHSSKPGRSFARLRSADHRQQLGTQRLSRAQRPSRACSSDYGRVKLVSRLCISGRSTLREHFEQNYVHMALEEMQETTRLRDGSPSCQEYR